MAEIMVLWIWLYYEYDYIRDNWYFLKEYSIKKKFWRFEDTKGLFRSRKSKKNKQRNDKR